MVLMFYTLSNGINMSLIAAVIHNDAKTVEQILSTGVDPNACQDAANVTPLHFAAQHNAIAVVGLLITAGANIHARTEPDGQTPLDIAILHGHKEIREIFEEFSRKMPPENY